MSDEKGCEKDRDYRIGNSGSTCMCILLYRSIGRGYLPGAISVSSSPSDARVTIDGCNWIDNTPCKTPDLPLDNYTVRVSLEGYQEWSKTVEAKFNETTYVHATLTPNPTPEAPITVLCAVIALIISGIIATKTKVRKN